MVGQAKGSVGFLDNLRDFFLYDDLWRWRAIGWTIAIAGAFGSAQLVFAGASPDDAVFGMGMVVAFSAIGWVGWYCSFRPQQSVGPSLSRRNMLLQLLTGLAGASLGVILLRFQIRTSERILERAAADPVEPENIDEANGLLARARGAQVRISMQTLEKTGRRFVLASRQNPSAWNVALGFLAYRSSINPKAPAGPAHKGEPLVQTAYDYHRVRGTEAPRFSVTGVVATPSAAQLDYIGEDLNRNQAKGFAYIFAEGGSMAIDGMHLRHVILLGVHVEYFGGPLQLEDVYFLNCDFKMDLGRNTQDLALAMLEPSPATTFSAA